MQAKEIKTGAVINHEGQPVMVESLSVSSPIRAGRRDALQIPSTESDHETESRLYA